MDIPTPIPAPVQIVDPKTGQLTVTGLQKLNEIIRALRDHETRITDLEP
jgi:ferric-dicitrate binding protein FerR (iron transport regulator)